MKKMISLSGILAVLLVFFSCTTPSKGTLFKETYASYSAPEKSTAEVNTSPGDEEEEVTGLVITTSPEHATVYINRSYYGSAPLTLEDLPAGQYRLDLEAPGYYPATVYLNYDGEGEDIHIALEPVTGYLDVHANIPGAEVLVDGSSYSRFPVELQIGSYRMLVRAFGYQEEAQYIEIEENRTTYADVELFPAAFVMSGLSASRRYFNPRNGGLLGTTEILFQVTSFGSARLSIHEQGGREIWSTSFPSFSTWQQSVRWDGRDRTGRHLPDGDYTLRLAGRGDGESEDSRLESVVTIDRSFSFSPQLLWSGNSGLMYTATPSLLPPFGFQFSTHALVSAGVDNEGNTVFLAPLSSGFRLGLPAESELNFSFNPVLIPAETFPFTISGGYKHRMFSFGGRRILRGALAVRGTYVRGTNADTFTNYTGLSLGLPLALQSGALSLYANPELTLSPFRVIYGSAVSQQPAFRTWLYGKLGMQLDLGWFSAGLSASVRSQPLGGSFAPDPPYNAGCEFHFLVPGSELFVTLAGAMEFISTAEYYINYGVGIVYLH